MHAFNAALAFVGIDTDKLSFLTAIAIVLDLDARCDLVKNICISLMGGAE